MHTGGRAGWGRGPGGSREEQGRSHLHRVGVGVHRTVDPQAAPTDDTPEGKSSHHYFLREEEAHKVTVVTTLAVTPACPEIHRAGLWVEATSGLPLLLGICPDVVCSLSSLCE